jgi:hypothetical protein
MSDEPDAVPTGGPEVTVTRLTPASFVRLGLGHIAYVRPILVDGAAAVAIHAADGTQMAVAPDTQVAMAAIRQHEMEPLSLH